MINEGDVVFASIWNTEEDRLPFLTQMDIPDAGMKVDLNYITMTNYSEIPKVFR